MKRRIKHNNLLPWFTEDHARLPASYVKSCQKFFQEIGEKTLIARVEFYAKELLAARRKLQAARRKLQATSSKPQATSDKLSHIQTTK
jgi:hypothetical protein